MAWQVHVTPVQVPGFVETNLGCTFTGHGAEAVAHPYNGPGNRTAEMAQVSHLLRVRAIDVRALYIAQEVGL